MDNFKQFLIRNNLYDKFVHNLNEYSGFSYNGFILWMNSWNFNFKFAVEHAFNFSGTKEGIEFWDRVRWDWYNTYKRYIDYIIMKS